MSMKSKLKRDKKRQSKQRRSASAAGRLVARSPQSPARFSQWLEAQEDKRKLLESLDPMTGLRHALRDIGRERGDWSGIPMPMEGERLVVEPTYPNAKAFMAMCDCTFVGGLQNYCSIQRRRSFVEKLG
jgi:hypothetical protein